MKLLLFIQIVLLYNICSAQNTPTKIKIRWCAYSSNELLKCQELAGNVATSGMGTGTVTAYEMECVEGNGQFSCMDAINQGTADMMTLDMGLAYYASLQYALRPVAVENYAPSNLEGQRNLHYESLVIVPKGENINPDNLKGRQICISGVGTAEGWIMPLSRLIKDQKIPITQCNSMVDTMTNFFDTSCAPGSLEEPFNKFGDNTDGLCKLCKSQADSKKFCSYRDPYSWSQGALKCLNEHRTNLATPTKRPTMAFVRSGEVELAVADYGFPINDYELFCPTIQADGTYRASLTNSSGCSWGSVQSNVIVTHLTREPKVVQTYRAFLNELVAYFSPNGAKFTGFNMFTTPASLAASKVHHLMFSDTTQNLYSPTEAKSSTYYILAEPGFITKVNDMTSCPILDVRWCVISDDEMKKCQKMKSALDSKKIKPEFNCILGHSTVKCMRYISEGYADLITLDAADLYVAGIKFELVPIATEYYGDKSSYYAVAIVKKTNKHMAISTLKNQRTCHSAVGKATGWVVPLNIVLETKQINVYKGNLLFAFSELVSRACVPGLLNDEYNPNTFNSLNLCEICAAGGQWKCQRDSRENYYGDSGAFRCLVEGGDVAFAKHTTVRENTGGRNLVYWARNRRSDDYELLCSDGSRGASNQWRTCNLGLIPGNTVVTGKHKTEAQREALWRMLSYAQSEYSSDLNEVFSMFKSEYGRSDIMFSDSAVSLKYIPYPNQTYSAWLGKDFVRQVENLYTLSSWGESGMYSQATPAITVAGSLTLTIICVIVNVLLVRNVYT